jgi:uncharacterized membrane protein YhaH (DUF805 family)
MSGRDYFAAQLAIVIIGLILGLARPSASAEHSVNWAESVAGVALAYFWWISTIRRFHDTGRSGWNSLWFGLLGAILTKVGIYLGLLAITPFALLAAISWLTLQPSTSTANRWGPPSPLSGDTLHHIARSRWNYVVLVLPALIGIAVRYISAV